MDTAIKFQLAKGDGDDDDLDGKYLNRSSEHRFPPSLFFREKVMANVRRGTASALEQKTKPLR